MGKQEPVLVEHLALKGYLQTKQRMSERNAKAEATRIWGILVDNSLYVVEHWGLPIRLFCTTCGLEYGDCRHHWFESYERLGRYMPPQTNNWAIEVRSLLSRQTRAVLNQEIKGLGGRDGNSVNRSHLMAWLDHLGTWNLS